MTDIADFTWKGDTWWTVSFSCPSCEETVASNGMIYNCWECNWWETVEDYRKKYE